MAIVVVGEVRMAWNVSASAGMAPDEGWENSFAADAFWAGQTSLAGRFPEIMLG